ncbi:GHKL domain-containing protein [Companilactobacillus sp. HBUAS56275]|uniref:GHKL domain-containing protein n=1 Tax=Candidatus Companilactobacillus pullicola TaxID=2838523 RepID=A0A9D2CPC9_9LACO|nr:GHKL domain-containing protein [Candidatus Companilactobacillus pullicola]
MTFISPRLFAIFANWFLFFFLFGNLYQNRLSNKKKLIIYPSFILSFTIIEILLPISKIFLDVFTYFYLRKSKDIDYYLLNILIVTAAVKVIAIFLFGTVFAVIVTVDKLNAQSFLQLSVIYLAIIVISVIFILIYNFFKLNKHLDTKTPLTTIVLGYVYLIFYIILTLVQSFATYPIFILITLLFIVIQSIFVIIVFLYQRVRNRKAYQDKFAEEQVKNLKIYTDQLESDQLKLRHFKHDYKNLLFSLKTVVDEQDYDAMNLALKKLENYSDDYLSNLSMELFQDLKNVHNSYLKSLLISKINTINQKNIVCHFTCNQELNDLPINIFDFINLLDNAIDNAIFFTQKQDNGEIYLSINQEGQQLAFLIYNSIDNQPDTVREEKKHLNKLHIKALRKKYSNLFIQSSQSQKWFRFNIILITKED